MEHAVEQQIKDNTLYVEVEPQPLPGSIFSKNEAHMKNLSPLSIGDTVYQGEEWFKESDMKGNHIKTVEKPIELADKTFRVTGIEVEEKWVPKYLEGMALRSGHEKWFWKYSLEELEKPIVIPPLTPYKEPDIPFGGLSRRPKA